MLDAEQPLDSPVVGEPHATYEALREAGDGVHRHEATGMWMLLRHADVSTAARDHARFSSVDALPASTATGPFAEKMAQLRSGVTRSLLFSDPPLHTKLRALFSRAFTPRAVERLRPMVDQLAADLVAALPAGEEVDLVERLAAPLPVAVIAEMLGVPVSDRAQFSTWSDAVTVAGSPVASQEAREHALPEVIEFNAYMRKIVADRKAAPGEDLLSALLAAEVDGDRLADEEVAGLGVLLLTAGNETTRTLIANAVDALLAHPDQFERLREDPTLVAGAVEEVLRFSPPVHLFFRRTTEEIRFGDTVVPPDARTMLMVASANRDHREFPDPHRFDITRTPNRHQSFGYGIHVCVGAPLARQEAIAILPRLLERFPKLTHGDAPAQRLAESHAPGFKTYPVKLLG